SRRAANSSGRKRRSRRSEDRTTTPNAKPWLGLWHSKRSPSSTNPRLQRSSHTGRRNPMDHLDGLRTRLVIDGGRRLEGSVEAPGAKNAALPIMAAAILAEGEVVLHAVPRITDVDVMA